MKKEHIGLAVLVTLAWGVNFPITKLGLDGVNPFVLAAVRFALSSIPFVFFIKRPSVHFEYVCLFGLIFGVAMWGLINLGISIGVPAGLASLVVQLSAVFSVAWGALFFGERLRPLQILGGAIAIAGLAYLIAESDGSFSIYGLFFVIMGAFSWSVGNAIIKISGVGEVFSFTVWASLFPPVPLLLCAIVTSGSVEPITQLSEMSEKNAIAVLYQVLAATHFAYWGWNSLLRKYPVSSVAPLSLLVPVFGMVSSIIILKERIDIRQMLSVAAIIGGVGIGIVGPSLCRKAKA